MNLIDNNQHLPPGLIDNGVEFFLHENEVKCLHKGSVLSFDQFPTEVLETVESDMLANPKAMKALADWNITDQNNQIKQYITCRFGGFDNSPDICTDGNIKPAEYVNCGRRGQCAYEGKLCASIQLENGVLTKREIDVLKLIGLGLLDKEITDLLSIAQDTLRNHKDNISQKAGISRKAALSVLAYRLKLID
jgi:DNA-binding CsgD family transcriptional regulator